MSPRALALGLALGWAAAAGPGLAEPIAGQVPCRAAGRICLGLLAPLTGPFAPTGEDMAAGARLALAERGWRIAGRVVRLVVDDTQGTPATALAAARKQVETDGIHVLSGGLLATTGYALRAYVDARRVPTTLPVVTADDLTQRRPSAWVLRTGWTASQPMHAFAAWVERSTPHRRLATIAVDSALGWESVGGFQRVFEELGSQVVQRLWVPVDVLDFTPWVARIRRDADATLAVFAGPAAPRFVQEYARAGLKARLPLLAAGSTTDETVLARAGEAALGVVTASPYARALDRPDQRRFARAFEARHGRSPSAAAEACYTNAHWIARAIETLGGEVDAPERLIAALRATSLEDAPRGPLVLDRAGNPIQHVYVRRVERVGGRLQNSVIATLPPTGQFWTYAPQEFLRAPLYSRDVPPCRHCDGAASRSGP